MDNGRRGRKIELKNKENDKKQPKNNCRQYGCGRTAVVGLRKGKEKKMNDFVSNLNDYNCEGRKAEDLPVICWDVGDIPESYYDYGAYRNIRISGIYFNVNKPTRFQKRLRKLCSTL